MILAGKAFCSASAGYIFEARMKEIGCGKKKHPPDPSIYKTIYLYAHIQKGRYQFYFRYVAH